MAEYDGSIKFSTKLDTSEFEKGLTKLSTESLKGFGAVKSAAQSGAGAASKSIQTISKSAEKVSKDGLQGLTKSITKVGPAANTVGKEASKGFKKLSDSAKTGNSNLKLSSTAANNASKSYSFMAKSMSNVSGAAAKSGSAVSDKLQKPVESAVDTTVGKVNELSEKMSGDLVSTVGTVGGLFQGLSDLLINASANSMVSFADTAGTVGQKIGEISSVINFCSSAIQNYQTVTALANTVSKTAEAISLLRAAGATKLQTVTALLTGTLTAESTVTAAKTVAEGAAAVGTEAHAAAQTTLNAAMSANPIGLVVAGLAALTVGIVAAKAATEKAHYEFFNMGDALDTASQKFTEVKEKADLTDDYASKWRELDDAIKNGKLSGEELKNAEGKRKEYEQWFIDNYGDYISAEEQKNGIRRETIDKLEEQTKLLSESARLELESQTLEMKRDFPNLKKKVQEEKNAVDELQNHNDELLKQNVILQKASNEWDEWLNDSRTDAECNQKRTEILNRVNSELGTNINTIGNLDELYKENKETIEDNNKELEQHRKDLKDGTDSMQSYADSCRQLIEYDLGDTLQGFSEKFELVHKAQDEVASSGRITNETLDKLKKSFPDFAGEFEGLEGPGKTLNTIADDLNTKMDTAKGTARDFGVELNGLPKELNIDIKLNVPKIPTTFSWLVPGHFARGTHGAPGGPAVVNDGNGPELIQSKNGEFKMVQSKGAALTWLDRGDRVYTAEQTRAMMKRVPHYKNGIGNSGYTGTVSITSFVEDVPEAFDKAMDELELRRDLDVIDEAQYYAELEKLRDKYFTKGSDKWWEYEKEIYSYQKEQAEDAAESVLDEIEKRHDLGLMSEEQYIEELAVYRSQYYAEGTKEYAEMTDKLNKLARDNELDMLEFHYSMGLYTEQEYYEKLTEYRDKHFAAGSADWMSYTQKISDYHTNKIKKAYDEIAEHAGDKLEDLLSKQESLYGKLDGYGSLTKTVTIKNYYEDGSDLQYRELNDIAKDNDFLRKYNESITAVARRLKESGLDEAAAAKLYNELLEMSPEEAAEFAELLTKATDAEFEKYITDYKENMDLLDQVSKNPFREAWEKETKELKSGLEELGYEVPEDFLEVGENSAVEFSRGFLDELKTQIENMKTKITGWTISMVPQTAVSAAGGGATTVYSPTYNLYGSGETDVARIQSAKAYSERERMAGGY